ncbi:hypothetical protein KIN20_021233 [Parelaphostrongylus tenuis]|uniref:Uncharacterized protein n=1 Tax=Parelaphostrongylus tenuis TaxID=148309 RepID=A0AAD5N455_PARTN|nr:hypothetical protein KIN20_021233 [Parelaphostrongylus tenuis]
MTVNSLQTSHSKSPSILQIASMRSSQKTAAALLNKPSFNNKGPFKTFCLIMLMQMIRLVSVNIGDINGGIKAIVMEILLNSEIEKK